MEGVGEEEEEKFYLVRVRYIIKARIISDLIGAKRYFYSLVQEPEGKINEINKITLTI